MARLFFALWPDPAARDALAALGEDIAQRCGGRSTSPAKIHLTLAFLGERPEASVDSAMAAAAGVRASPFAVRLDRAGAFAGSGVAWAGMSEVPLELAALVRDLHWALSDAGFVLETRPFAAHATVARRVRRKVEGDPAPPIEWQAKEFTLVESDLRTGRYTTRGRWVLGAR